MKRILLLIPTITSYHTFLRELMEELVRLGWETHLGSSLKPIAGLDCYEEPVAGVAHHISFPRGANPLKHWLAGRELNALIRRIKPDLVHCHFSSTSFTAAVARRRAWPPTIATIQGLIFAESTGLRKLVFSAAEGLVSLRMDGTWVLTEADREALRSVGIRRNIFLQRSPGFGCRLMQFDSSRFTERERRAVREKLQIKPDDFVFVFVGRQVHFKGFALVIRAFLELDKTASGAKLLLLGQRDPLHATGLTPVEEKAWSNCSGIISVGWQEDVANYLSIAQVNVFPSRREGMPVNLMESLAMGIPVITSNSRGCQDVVRDNIDGLILTDSSIETLGQAMQRLMNNDLLRSNFSQNALSGRDRFDRKHWIDEQVEIYERLVLSPAGSA